MDVRILLQECSSQFVARLLKESPSFCFLKEQNNVLTRSVNDADYLRILS
uniref:Uncharacterized protein n=2 Tax=Vibrio TaxID=662 RepID=A0A0H3ZN62_9VIBR|nr:hypothetical protein [Vibrio tasmaniensis]AKN39199.1 hypothetical protein [Vibrio splendidus]